MPLFSRKNRPDNNSSDFARKKNMIDLQCPECGFEQREPNIAVSTYCRGCSTHYKIEGGKAVPKRTRTNNPFASLRDPNAAPELRDRPASDDASSHQQTSPPHPEQATANTPSQTKTVRKPLTSPGFLQNKSKPRSVSCFECDHTHNAPNEASSTLCPSCGAYIALKDYDIRENWNRRIQTRGDVTIQKKATVTGITIRCHNLTVLGKLTGGVDCSGDFAIQSHGKIMGKVQCKTLIIEKRAQVEFSNPVKCDDAIIDGEVTGHFTCSGKLHLKKKATLSGNIKVASMAVDEGARHHGQVSFG